MRISFVITTILAVQISLLANSQKGISVDVKKESLHNVLALIEQNSSYRFLYKDNPVFEKIRVTLNVTNESIDNVMKKILTGTGLVYTVNKKELVVLTTANAENTFQPITGLIKDDKGDPLANATITVKGTAKGTATNATGQFTIDANQGDVLVISSVGYLSQEIKISNQSSITISMVQGTKPMDEVLVIGYGTQKKVNLTGSVASVGGDKLDNRPIVNLGDGLVGLIPNLNVNLGNGQPGVGASFNVRGYTSISGGSTAPLVLVDGVQRDPNLIDPNNVETVTVLKDASSAAIYGGRAAYGVILITTKNAKKGGKPQISYTGSYATSRPTNLPKYVNSVDYINLFNSAQRTGALTGGSTSTDPFTAKDSALVAAYVADPAHNSSVYVDPGNPNRYRYVGNTDWIKVMYPGWAPQQEHFLSVSAGEGKTTYTASLGYFRQMGLEKVANQIYQRFTPDLKINSEINSWLTVNLNMSMTHTSNNGGSITINNAGGSTGGGSWIPGDLRPVQPVYHPDGNFSGQGSYTNPVAVLTLSGREIDSRNDIWTTGRVILKPVKHLTVTSDFTWNNLSDFNKANTIPYNEYGVNGVFLNIFPWTNPSRVIESKINNNYTAFNAYATYENTFKEKHYVKLLAGYNQEYQHYQNGNTLARNLIDPNLPAIGTNTDSKPAVVGVETEYALIGSFFRLNYIYNKRYLLEVNGRYDGTSRFQPGKKYVFSPSVSAGWNISEEAFMQNIKGTVNELKLRASYGVLPNQLAPTTPSSTGQYPYIATMPGGTVGYLFNGQPGITVGAPGLISPSFTWEKVQTTNFGIDYSLLRDRLSGSFDYFITYTKDMLVPSAQLPAALGTTAPPTNAADLKTRGWELSLTWRDRALDNKLTYSATLGLSDYFSVITRYNGNPTVSLGTFYPGQRTGNIWGYNTLGYYATDAEAAAVNNSALAGYKWLAGDIKYEDVNKDGKIGPGANTLADHGDQVLLGNTTPRYRISLNLNLMYKGFDFTMFTQGVLKAAYNPVGSGVFNAFAGSEYTVPYLYSTDYWTPTHTDAYFARPRFGGGGNNRAQTKYIQSAAFARIKQITLGYSLPKQIIGKLKIQKVRVYATGANLITFTSLFKGFDPEIINYGGGFNAYPLNKSVSFGLQVTL